jgi:AcrR family transcriptional regulator
MKRLDQSRRRVRIPGSERKRIILERAMELFARRGFHGISIEEIAKASKISKPVLYDHFHSKHDLYFQVSREIRERLLVVGKRAIVSQQGLASRVRAGVEAFFVFAEKNPAAIRILLSPYQDDKRLCRAIQGIHGEATASITKMILDAGVTVPENEMGIEQLKIQAEFVKQGLHALAEWRTQHPSVSRDTVVDAISKLICSGLD